MWSSMRRWLWPVLPALLALGGAGRLAVEHRLDGHHHVRADDHVFHEHFHFGAHHHHEEPEPEDQAPDDPERRDEQYVGQSPTHALPDGGVGLEPAAADHGTSPALSFTPAVRDDRRRTPLVPRAPPA